MFLIVAETAEHECLQMLQVLRCDHVADDTRLGAFTLLLTNTDCDLDAIRHRDRCECKNGVDELKSRWGWGCTTYDMKRTELIARAVARV